MSLTRFSDFSELYRAAFAETDVEKQLSLLHEVQRIINSYSAESGDEPQLAIEAV